MLSNGKVHSSITQYIVPGINDHTGYAGAGWCGERSRVGSGPVAVAVGRHAASVLTSVVGRASDVRDVCCCVLLVGLDGCEVCLRGPCAFVRPRVPRCVSRVCPAPGSPGVSQTLTTTATSCHVSSYVARMSRDAA